MSRKWEGCVSSPVWPRQHPYLKHRVIPVDIQSSPQCINLAFLYKDVLTNLKQKNPGKSGLQILTLAFGKSGPRSAANCARLLFADKV